MNNTTNYLEEFGKYSFAEHPFIDEDALILSQLCYLKFDNLVPGMDEEPISFYELDNNPEKENLFWDKRYEKDNRALYEAAFASRRFHDLKIGYYNNIIDRESEFQFSAMTFFLDDGTPVVTFRGTDETMAGWQEDFAMLLKKPVPGQALSLEYLKTMAGIINGNFYVTGHSKGGNLSMYSVLCSDKEIQDRVIRIISFDGPGFRPEFIASHLTDEIFNKAITYIPKSSPIGLMLNTPANMVVINAKSIGAMQHNPFNWVFKDGKLVETELSEQHKVMMKATNEFLFSMDDEQCVQFVRMMCWMLDATKADTTIEFQDNVSGHFKALYTANKEDPEVRDLAVNFTKSYLTLAGDNIKSEVRIKYEETLENIRKTTTEAKNGISAKYDEIMKKKKK